MVAFISLFGYGWRVGQTLYQSLLRLLLGGLLLVSIGWLIVGIKAVFH